MSEWRAKISRLTAVRPTIGQLALFLFVWLMVGFFSGTLTLLGPVRWLTAAMRSSGWSDGSEKIAVMTVIAAFVGASLLFSVWSTRKVAASDRVAVRAGVPMLFLALAAAAMWLWLSPSLVNSFQPVQVTTVSGFTFGPYPDRERFERLVAEGFTAVVSLLHPTGVPFEAPLLSRERELAEEFGIELIHAPLLPWIGDNTESLNRIRELAEAGGGIYYVHCYLGRDRASMVHRLVERASPESKIGESTASFALGSRPAFVRGSFERGAIVSIDEGVWLTPFPTDEELLQHFLASEVRHVVSLLDPENPDDVQWIEREKAALAEHSVSYRNMPVPWMRYSPDAALAAANHVRTAPRPVLVHAFHSRGTAAEAFRLAYASRVPPVTSDAFAEPLAAGAATVVGVNVVYGPRPSGPEFGSVLEAAGIRSLAYLGDPSHEEARTDRLLVRTETGMTWRLFSPDSSELLPTLASGGPWYVYGPGLESVQARIDARFAAARERMLNPLAADAVAAGQ